MQAVGRIGSYISKSVYTVSGTFHPFGGAVDIIVVEQPDGSYKSSPWYVRFGKFQGVLKTKEKVVGISVNDVEADFHMHLDSKGEAFFMQEVDAEEGESAASPPSSSGEDMEGPPRWPLKSKSCNYDSTLYEYDPIGNDRKALTRANTRQSQFFGFFGRRPPTEESVQGKENAHGVKGEGSLEVAERAADLLDLKWSTNLASSKRKKDNASTLSAADASTKDVNKNSPVDGSAHDELSLISQISCQELKRCAEANGVEMKCLTSECIVTTSVGSVTEHTALSNSEPLMTDALGLGNLQMSSVSVVSEVAKSDSEIQDSIEKLDGLSDANLESIKKLDSFSDANFSTVENARDNNQSFYSSEISGSSAVGLEGSSGGTNNSFCHGGCREVCIHTKDQFTIVHEEKISVSGGVVTECYSQLVCRHQSNDSLKDSDSQNIAASTSSFSTCLPMDEHNILGDKDKLDSFAGPLSDPHIPRSLSVPPCIEASRISEEELLVFGNLDDFGHVAAKYLEFSQSDHEGKEADPLFLSGVAGGGIGSSDAKCCSSSLLDQSDINDYTNDVGLHTRRLSSIPTDVHINETGNVHSEGPIRMSRSLPCLDVLSNNLEASDPGYFSNASLYPVVDSCTDKNDQFSGAERTAEQPASKAGYPPRAMDTLGGNGRIPYRRSRGIKVSDVMSDGKNLNGLEIPNKSSDVEREMDMTKVKVNKKKVRTLTPTSKHLASLNLKEGKNVVIFTFSTAMLGKQQVDARIFLWRWDTKIVISDVDGTITRSDLLGQVMPLVGMDWSQTGVAHLFSAIKENGYQLLFLSARSISQSYITRQFLLNIKQDGKALPEGPVVISPDGLFPSLFREVVRRAPHEFKIACLEDIKALFPPDRNPFYAGFGNRDTDEVSYLKVGIPRGKIFIINPKGEIAVNRRVDTKSYVTLHALVHGMFPHTFTCEQEDFNSWNFWKLPPPSID
ncbi:phosphatidic acid phosphohydrolase 2 [Perilla frutescens var. frutescens]|nr:phosphatidic acid phosphohydrolase 2 [Perilla frutescens var. frutescens]